MSQLVHHWSRHHRLLAMFAAAALLVSLSGAWLRADAGSLGAVQAAQLFLGPLAWLLLVLMIAAVLQLLLPLHAMRRATVWLAVLALPAWLVVAGALWLGVHGLAPTWGMLLAGLAAAVLTGNALTELRGPRG